ncbi:MAG: NAD-dependent epimerase/dehydratase family protein, partial [Mobilitalea sp.]
GGSGFIGSNLGITLLAYHYDVYSFDMLYPNIRIEGVNYIIGDFFDDFTLNMVIKGMDYVVHSLSTVNPGNSNEKYMQGYERDFIQTVKLCEILIKENIKLLFISSGGTIYGDKEIQPIREDVLPNPINHYGNLKLCIENTISTFNKQENANMMIARISNPYGPGQDFTRGVGFVDAALKKAITKQPIEIWGNGSVVRDYIYIDDVCQMLEKLLEYNSDEVIFNISSGHGTSQNNIIEILHDMGLEEQVIYKDARSVDAKKVVLDNSKIMRVYHKEIISITEGIDKYYHWLINFAK